MGYALLVCRGQTEAMGIRRHLAGAGILGDITRPPRVDAKDSCSYAVRIPFDRLSDATHTLQKLSISPCRIVTEGMKI